MTSNVKELNAFCKGVMDETIVAGRLVRLAVQRHLMDLEFGANRGLSFDERTADDAIEFFPLCCKHTTGEFSGQPFELRQWQKFVIGVLFGWKRSDGFRRFRDAFVSVARGNGKSPLGAGIGLQLFCFDQPIESRAEVYSVATKRDQAKIVWEEAVRMVESGPLSRIVERLASNMHVPKSHSKFEPLGSDSKNTDGFIIHGVIRDELHEWREKHRGLYDKIETAMGKRRQPLAVTITTAGDDNSEIWDEQHAYSSRVVEQVLNPPDRHCDWFGDDHFSFICEVDKDDDIYDESNWQKANPMLLEPNSPVKIDHLQSMASKAKAGDIISELRFRRYHCNQKVAAVEKPYTAELWAKGDQPLTISDGALAFGGFDLARSDDFAAVSLVFPVETDSDVLYEVKSWAWTTTERPTELNSAEVLSVVNRENVIIHEGNQIDFADIRRHIADLSHQYMVRSWAFDPAFARDTAQMLREEHGLEVNEFPQNALRYNEPILKFSKLLREGRLRHDGCPLLKWQSGNLMLKPNAQGLVMPDKQNSRNKIDSMVALFMAMSEAMFTEKESAFWNPSDGILL